jgi:S1-C subfamily serine protease
MRFAIRGISGVVVVAMTAVQAAWAGGIPIKTLKELKAASVYIKVEFRRPLEKPIPATGSGFVIHASGETGLIATNHHVVSPLPGEILNSNPKVIFHSGTPQEVTVEGQVVASDPGRDLAILKVAGVKNLPRPIPLDPSIEVGETMTVYALGFPFGQGLALGKANPAITITRGTVSSLRQDKHGQIKLVQIDAEINPGNSGGPVVDEKGKLVGVAVSKILKSRIGFAVPTPPLEEILQGKVGPVAFETMKVEKGKAQVNVEAKLLDPLGRLKDVVVYYSAEFDAKDLPRADKLGKIPLLANARRIPLKADQGTGLGALSLAGSKNKESIAYQVSYVNSTGKTIVTPANVAVIDFTQIVYVDKLTPTDPRDKRRGQPSKSFRHAMQAGKHYVIEMRGNPKVIDPWLIVRDAAGVTLAEDDDSGGLLNSLIVFSPTRTDDYDIVATVFKGAPVGPFTLRIREETGLPLGPKGLFKTSILSETDPLDPVMQSAAHFFNLIMKRGKTYLVTMKSKEFDPYVRLENMAGVNVKGEDSGGGGQSTLVFTPEQDGIYKLFATTFDFKTGPFELRVVEGPARRVFAVGPKGLSLNGSLTNNDPFDIVNGKLTKKRCKVAEVQLKGGQKYQIDLSSIQFDAFLRVENGQFKQLAFDDDSGGNLNARLIFVPPADGVYRIIATHFDGKLGNFNLTVKAVP